MTRRPGMLDAIVALTLLALVASAGCGAIFDYPEQHTETGSARCRDGADNDFDGDVDHDDADCATPESGRAACHDGEDNDLDRKVDQLDPDCATPESGAACRDGQDNDLDRKVDQLDPDCAASESSYAACHDELDNDLDGRPDERDPACEELWQERSEAACLDSDARDEDEDGRANCADSECAAFCPEGTSTPGTCADGLDNDADELTDCDDVVDCAGSCPEDDGEGDARCTDEVDNDGDGYVDGSDPLCWPSFAPEVQRCSLQGATLDETFDGSFLGTDPRSASWYEFGFESSYPFGQAPPLGRTTRSDLALELGFDRGRKMLAGVGSRGLLSGKWADFELALWVSVVPDAQVRLSLVPVEQAPDNEPPRAGTELLTLTVSASNTERTASLEQGGRSVRVETPAPETCGQDFCEGGFERFTLRLDDGELVARFAGEALPRLPLVGLGDSAPRSRVVVTGRGSLVGGAYVDDLHAGFARSLPCGFFVPQMPSGGPDECALPVAGGSIGSAVSAAAGPDGYCALLSRSEAEPPIGPGPTLVPASSVQAWRSDDGDHWQHGGDEDEDADATGDVPVGPEVDVIGQAVAWDPEQEGWVAAVASRDARMPLPDPGLWLQLFASRDCVEWQELGDEQPLPEDAEPPSLLVEPSGELELYFTRPATSATGRTLWRMALGSADDLRSEAELRPVVELEPELHVDPPVSLQRVGTDFVLGYRLDASAGDTGLGVAVSDRRLRGFRRTASWPSMRPNTQVGFDDVELLSGTVLWREGGGLLLYAARGSQGSFQTVSGAGTALLRPAGTDPRVPDDPPPDDEPPDAEDESSTSLLDDAELWSLTDSDSVSFDSPVRHCYVDPVLERLQYADVSFSTSPVLYRPLPTEITAGDFELSFDLQLSAGSSGSSRIGSDCYAQIGIGRGEPMEALASEGVFVELVRNYECFASATVVTAAAVAAGSRWSSFEGADLATSADEEGACTGAEVTDTSEWQHVTLRRDNGTVRVRNRRDTPCGPLEGSVTTAYEGALDGLDELLVRGNGCGLTFALRNVAIRSLRDAGECSDTLCSEGPETLCVELDHNPEHCGDCTTVCSSGSRCIDGECACRADLLECGASCVVEDSPGNCGGCGLDPCGDDTCVFGGCSVDVGETCDDPSVVPPEGGTAFFRLGDLGQVADHQPCGADFFHDAAFRWTPSESGPVTIDVISSASLDIAYPVLAVSEDESCGASSSSCHHVFDAEGAHATFDAEAGTPYFIVVGSDEPDAPTAPLALRVDQVSP